MHQTSNRSKHNLAINTKWSKYFERMSTVLKDRTYCLESSCLANHKAGDDNPSL